MLLTNHSVIESHRDRTALIEFWDNGIIFIKIDDNVQVELEDSERQYNFLRSKFNGVNKLRVLVEPGRFTSISNEAREFSAAPERNAMTIGSAVLVKSLAHRIVINFMINFIRKQSMKMRMFDSKEKAIEWLLELKD